MSERRKKQLGSIRITRLDSRGRGRGVHLLQDGQERSVAVAGALPGDLVDVRVTRRKAGTFLGEIDRIEETDHPRTVPFCRHFGECGGCTTQNLAYRDQLLVKESMVRAAFREAGLTDAAPDGASPDEPDEPRDPAPDVRPIVPSRQERYYRNKLEYSFGAQRWLTEREIQDAQEISDRRGLGFHAPGRFDRVIDISECYLQPEPSSRIREFFRTLAVEQGYSYYDAREHRGLLRLLIVRTSLTGEVMVTVMFGEEDADARRHIMDTLAERFPEIVSLNYVINTSRNDSLYPHEVVTWRGAPYITERSGPNLLRIRPKAFYQTNPEQAQRLYETALEDVPGSALAFDLYSGIGSIALLLARRAERVVGVESVPDAVKAARENAELNGLKNVVFEEGEVDET